MMGNSIFDGSLNKSKPLLSSKLIGCGISLLLYKGGMSLLLYIMFCGHILN